MGNDEMMFKDDKVVITIKYPDGRIESDEYHNMVVTEGLQQVAAFIGGFTSKGDFKYVQIGTSSTASSTGMTALVSEVMSTTATLSLGTTNVSLDTVKYSATYAISTTEALREAGIFNNAPGSTTIDMFARVTFPVKNLANGSEFTINWNVVA